MAIVPVTAAQVRELGPMPAAIEAVRGAFLGLAGGEFEMPHRTSLDGGRFLVTAAHHRPTGSVVTKTLSLSGERAPAIVGVIAWTDLRRADTLALAADAVTSLRTGAVVGVATDLLAPAGAGRLVLFGAGGQAADQVRAVHAVRPLRSLTVVARRPERADTLLATLAPELPGVELSAVALPGDPRSGDPRSGDQPTGGPLPEAVAEALARADLVACATPASAPLFPAEALAPGVHVSAVGSYRASMRELPADLLAGSLVVVDQVDAATAEAGEIIHGLERGALDRVDLHELGALLGGASRPAADRTVFKSVGLAIQDWAIADLIAARLLPLGD